MDFFLGVQLHFTIDHYIFLYWEIGYTFLKQQEQCFYEKT